MGYFFFRTKLGDLVVIIFKVRTIRISMIINSLVKNVEKKTVCKISVVKPPTTLFVIAIDFSFNLGAYGIAMIFDVTPQEIIARV